MNHMISAANSRLAFTGCSGMRSRVMALTRANIIARSERLRSSQWSFVMGHKYSDIWDAIHAKWELETRLWKSGCLEGLPSRLIAGKEATVAFLFDTPRSFERAAHSILDLVCLRASYVGSGYKLMQMRRISLSPTEHRMLRVANKIRTTAGWMRRRKHRASRWVRLA
jgi:hypothetical protein